MDYGMIGKIEKAKRYALQRDRITFNTFQADFQGSHNTYNVVLNAEGWHCTCPGYQSHHICPHIMAMEKLFSPMLKRSAVPYGKGQNVVSDIEKSTQYTNEPKRIHFTDFDVTFDGDNDAHQTHYHEGKWDCNCDFFHSRHVCSHTMAMEQILGELIMHPVPADTGKA